MSELSELKIPVMNHSAAIAATSLANSYQNQQMQPPSGSGMQHSKFRARIKKSSPESAAFCWADSAFTNLFSAIKRRLLISDSAAFGTSPAESAARSSGCRRHYLSDKIRRGICRHLCPQQKTLVLNQLRITKLRITNYFSNS